MTWEKIKKKILQFKISKAPGPDGLHPRLLKELAQQISQPLETIFQLSLKEGKVPTDWEQGEITAIHKKGSRRTAGNYRPVSPTCILCKIMESLLRETIIDHMCENSLFSKYQYGFINRRSTTLQLLFVIDEWTEILDPLRGHNRCSLSRLWRPSTRFPARACCINFRHMASAAIWTTG